MRDKLLHLASEKTVTALKDAKSFETRYDALRNKHYCNR